MLRIFILAILSFLSYYFLAFETIRENFIQLVFFFGLAFLAYSELLKKEWGKRQVYILLGMGFLFRSIFIFATPELSDDVYRFIWDGRLWLNGIEPYALLPSGVLKLSNFNELIGINQELYASLNSPNYYSVYPPFLQWIFRFGAVMFPTWDFGFIVFLKSIIILLEIGSVYFIISLLKHFEFHFRRVLIYALNPLVIVELTGNVHFEAAAICGLLGTIYFLAKNHTVAGGVSILLAIISKLNPLMWMPFWIKRLSFKKLLIFFLVCGLGMIFSFWSVSSISHFWNFKESFDLYFGTFEFNASIWNIIKYIGFQVKGYNILQSATLYLSLFVLIFIVGYSLFEKDRSLKNIFKPLLIAYFVYLLFATIVHPWYITPLIALVVFIPFRFPLVWSMTAVLSYFAYSNPANMESMKLIGLEYGIVLIVLIWDLLKESSYMNRNLKEA